MASNNSVPDMSCPEMDTALSGTTDPLAPNPALPKRFFPRNQCNPGFKPPAWLTDPEEIKKIEPPAVVKPWKEKFGELAQEQKDAFYRLKITVAENKWESMVDDWRILRYLVARQWNVKKATEMLTNSIAWEKEMDPANVVCQTCLKDPSSHIMQFSGWDLQHRPIIYVSYRYAKSRKDPDEAIMHNVETFEVMKNLMPVGVEQWVSITDFVSYSHWNDGAGGVGKKVIEVMQNHYPERLGAQILIDPPTTFWLLWKVLAAFIDEKTKSKVVFAYTTKEPNIRDIFPKMFPPHVSEYLLQAYVANKEEYAAEQKAKK